MYNNEEIKYEKMDDERLQETARLTRSTHLHRIYDFDAEQVITITNTLYDRSHDAAGAGVSTLVNSFNEVGARRLQKAHGKLLELGGNPPPLDEAYSGKPRRKKALKLGD